MKKDIMVLSIIFIFAVCLSGSGFVSASDITSLASVSYQGECGGSRWNASCDLSVVRDDNLSTFFGLKASTSIQSFKYDFPSSELIRSVSVIWHEGGSFAAPGNYSFSYWDGNQWVTPTEWIADESQQGFDTEYIFTLPISISTSNITLTRHVIGDGLAIGLTEFHVFEEDVPVTPEFPLIGGIALIAGGIFAFLVIRKR